MSPDRRGFRVIDGPPGVGMQTTLLAEHTLVIRNETALRLSRFARTQTRTGPRYYPLIKVLAPSEYTVTTVIGGHEREIESEHEDGIGIAQLSLPQERSRLVVGPYEFQLVPVFAPKGGALDVSASSHLAVPSIVIENRPSKSIKRLLIRERQIFPGAV